MRALIASAAVGLLLGLTSASCGGGGASGGGSGGSSGGDPCQTMMGRCDSATTYAFCDTGMVKTIECKGGCMNGMCDTTMHTLGDPCTTSGRVRCDPVVAQRALECKANVYVSFQTCHGPRGCFIESNALKCDITVNDFCPAASEGKYSCDTGQADLVLKCVDGGYAEYQRCPSNSVCARGDGGLICQTQ